MNATEHEGAIEDGINKAEEIPPPTAKVKVSDNDELAVWRVGEGAPVVMVHPALMRNFFLPVIDELTDKGGYQLIWYYRRGYNGTPAEPVGMADQATDIIKVLDALQIAKAHVVGHSYGANIALELVMQAPDRVLSAVLLEPGMVQQVESGKAVGEGLAPVMAKVESGDLEGASAEFLAVVGGSKELLEQALRGSWADLVKDSPTWFKHEIPALVEWKVDPAKAKAIRASLALGHGPDRLPNIAETRQLLQSWQPKMKTFEIARAEDHMFPMKQAAETAAALDEWFKGQGTPR